MKRVLCYGDSNTWGYCPGTGERFPSGVRWPSVLQSRLGDEWQIIEEGLNGRTTGLEDPIEPARNGLRVLPAILDQHNPLDVVLLMLGTNDLKAAFSSTAAEIAGRLPILVKTIHELGNSHNGGRPLAVVMAPPPLARLRGEIAEEFAGGYETSLLLATAYQRVAETHGYQFFDTSRVVRTSDVDGVHFDPDDHIRLGEAMAAFLRSLFS